jgi:hypothetical protein
MTRVIKRMLMTQPVRGDLGTNRGGADTVYFDDLADARARVQAEAYDNGDIREER